MITFSFDKIVEFLKAKGWERKKDTEYHHVFLNLPNSNFGNFKLLMPKLNVENPEKNVYGNKIEHFIGSISDIYKIPFHELALIHFAETPTVLTLGEYVSAVDTGVKEYADFLSQPFDVSQMSELFENFKEQYGSFYTPNDYVVIKFDHDCYNFLYDGNEMELPLPKTVEHFVTDFLRIVGKQKRLKFNHKLL